MLSKRPRSWATWVLCGVACVTAACWMITVPLTTRFVTILFQSQTFSIYVMKGSLCVEADDAERSAAAEFSVQPGFAMQRQVQEPNSWNWGIRLPFVGIAHGRHSQFNLIVIPLWLPFVLTALPVFVRRYFSRQSPPGYCPKCGYDLAKNLSGRCPECGTPIAIGASQDSPATASNSSKSE